MMIDKLINNNNNKDFTNYKFLGIFNYYYHSFLAFDFFPCLSKQNRVGTGCVCVCDLWTDLTGGHLVVVIVVEWFCWPCFFFGFGKENRMYQSEKNRIHMKCMIEFELRVTLYINFMFWNYFVHFSCSAKKPKKKTKR